MSNLKEISSLIRIRQWPKNLLVLVPGFFAGSMTWNDELIHALLGFAVFCLVCSAIYIFNDYFDREADRLDDSKKNRPLAKGSVSEKTALLLAIFALGGGVAISVLLPIQFMMLAGSYLGINILYTTWLKRVPIVDVIIIATGFLLRIFSGGILFDVVVSKWLVLITFFGALLVAFSKRRSELSLPNAREIRPALRGYNKTFIDLIIVGLSGICIMLYIMYAIDDEVIDRLNSNYVYLTVIPVIVGFLRYLQQVFVFNNTGAPSELLLKDHWLKSIVMLWLASFYFLLYA